MKSLKDAKQRRFLRLPLTTIMAAFCGFLMMNGMNYAQEAQGEKVDVRRITVVNYEFEGTKQWIPGTIVVNEGEEIELTLINNTPSGIHGFSIPDFKVKADVKKGDKKTLTFKADKAGIYSINCHLHPAHVGGQFVVLKK